MTVCILRIKRPIMAAGYVDCRDHESNNDDDYCRCDYVRRDDNDKEGRCVTM